MVGTIEVRVKMARCKKGRRGNMSIFRDFPTQQWAILAESLRDAGMASSSDKPALGKATSLPGGRLRPICSPFQRLDGADRGFTA
jgi:hypothetical protein